MTFEQYWKEYCIKHHLKQGYVFEQAIRPHAEAAWKAAWEEGNDTGYTAGVNR